MTPDQVKDLIQTIVLLMNTGVIAWLTIKKLRPEVKKLDNEADSELVEGANLNLEGAKISTGMLVERLNELKNDLDAEKKARREEQLLNEKARRDDVEYFRRRIKDLERENRDYRAWAAQLVRQVIDAGKIPAPFLPTLSDSDTGIPAVRENKSDSK